MNRGRILFALAVPGGLVLLGIALLLHTGLVPLDSAPLTRFYALAVFGAGMVLALRFRATRVLLGIVVLALAERGLSLVAAGSPSAFKLLAILVPLNLLVLLLVSERGLTPIALAPNAVILLVQAVAVLVIARPEHAGAAASLEYAVLNASWFSDTPVPQFAWLAALLALFVLGVRFSRARHPVDGGLFWAVTASLPALHFGGGRGTAYLTTAALLLLVSLVETSYRLAYHDELTSLPGRRAFNEALPALSETYAIAMLDVDHFKKFNDSFGHDTGDHVLRLVASRLARVGGGGRAYRCGGEEFAVLFPAATVREALPHLELLRRQIEETTFMVRGLERRSQPRNLPDRRQPANSRTRPRRTRSMEVSVTVSIGVAEAGRRLATPEQVITAADKALYAAKQAGRNRVETAAAPRRRTLARTAVTGN